MDAWIVLAGALAAHALVWFVIGVVRKRNDGADVAWGLGFILVAWLSWWLAPVSSMRGAIVTGLVTVWGVRLVWHIARRHWGKPEDRRYAAWRAAWGRWVHVRAFFQIYLLQTALLSVIAFPVVVIHFSGSSSLTWWDLGAGAIWAFGFVFEAVADAQLSRFLADGRNAGHLLRSGLWSWSRHPNYFGEVVQWYGIWLFALHLSWGWALVVSPLLITYLILRVSGVPMLEAKMRTHPEFPEYARTTSVFVPRPPRR